MSKLKHIKTKYKEYYKDKQHRIQGEYKYFHDREHTQLTIHSFYKDGKRHGESEYYENGKLITHLFWKDGKKISKQEYNEWQLKKKIEKVLV